MKNNLHFIDFFCISSKRLFYINLINENLYCNNAFNYLILIYYEKFFKENRKRNGYR